MIAATMIHARRPKPLLKAVTRRLLRVTKAAADDGVPVDEQTAERGTKNACWNAVMGSPLMVRILWGSKELDAASAHPTSTRAKLLKGCKRAVDNPAVQVSLYVVYVLMLFLLADSLRSEYEYSFTQAILDRIVTHETRLQFEMAFTSIRRPSDFWEWSYFTLIPALFANNGPCREELVGYGFGSSVPDSSALNLSFAERLAAKGCDDETWPTGSVPGLGGGRAYDVDEQVVQMDMFDWSGGIQIRQQRVKSITTSVEDSGDDDAAIGCEASFVGDYCMPELESAAWHDDSSFGFNWTHPAAPLSNPFLWWSADHLGAKPTLDSRPTRGMSYESSGHVAVIIPFFSDTYLPEQRGNSSEVIEFREHYANRFDDRNYRYFCVRLSWNGAHIHQLCDPVVVGGGPTLGIVRAAVEDFFRDLSQAHFIDFQTRALTVHMPLRSNMYGVRAQLQLILEFSSSGFVEPRYRISTAIENPAKREWTTTLLGACLGFTVLFTLIEIPEIVQHGVLNYVGNAWNLFDMLAYVVVFIGIAQIYHFLEEDEFVGQFYGTNGDAKDHCAGLCETVGFEDEWQAAEEMHAGRQYLAVCFTLLTLKLVKFAPEFVPRMGLMANVLAKSRVDLLFFGIIFLVSLAAFSLYFYIQVCCCCWSDAGDAAPLSRPSNRPASPTSPPSTLYLDASSPPFFHAGV